MVQEFNKVDLMYVEKNNPNTLCLGVTDHYDWTYPNEHLMVLQEKLNNYVLFILNKGFIAQYSADTFTSFSIVIMLKFEPDKVLEKFLKDYQEILRTKVQEDIKVLCRIISE